MRFGINDSQGRGTDMTDLILVVMTFVLFALTFVAIFGLIRLGTVTDKRYRRYRKQKLRALLFGSHRIVNRNPGAMTKKGGSGRGLRQS